MEPVADAISVHGLRFAYASETVLYIPEWRIASGARVFLRGASGSGKSTLLNLLCGMLRPSSGELKVLGQDLTGMGNHARDKFRARHLGVVFQQFNLIPWLTVRENIKLAAHFGSSRREWQDYLVELMQRVNLPAALLEQKAGALSIGQQQRVAVVRALINQPEILLVDEPTSALDQDNRDAFIELLLRTLDACGATLIFVSHDRSLAGHFSTQVDMAELNHAERVA
ncbi:ABC transporter ATP-binding protein [Saccharophagus sp. K07]|uniref:ABC transporter ATP-binding protein n=1 Tax=Saccharophagus sp. K07 TaxID=2283636 RepID=UPI0016529E58|nr:ABC transporter ATP-binding protein [Saccharophagus sp. K07]MBC6906855.1 ABC transporter ATP-binding protein [Saccharophagus sp. K07]